MTSSLMMYGTYIVNLLGQIWFGWTLFILANKSMMNVHYHEPGPITVTLETSDITEFCKGSK